MASPAQPASERLVLLDGLRGLAALGTVLFHVNIDGSAPAFARGYLFVDLFFLLSGFVLTLAFEPRFARSLDWRRFLAARCRRFWPLAAIGTAIGGLALHLDGMAPLPLTIVVACGVAMLPILAKGMLYPANAPQWSLLLELLLNACHAAILHKLPFRALAVLTGALGAGVVASIFLSGGADQGSNAPELPAAILRASWAYCLGILMARSWRRTELPPLCDWRVALALPVVHVVALTAWPIPVWIGDALTVTLAFPVLFWLAVRTIPPAAASRALTALGALSFPLYAIHFPLILLWQQLCGGGVSRLSALPLVVLAAAGLAWLLPAASRSRPGRKAAAAA